MNPEKTASPFDLQTTILSRAMLNHGLRRRHEGCPRPKIDFMRRPIAQRLVRPLVVVKLEIGGKTRPRLRDRLVTHVLQSQQKNEILIP